MLGRSKHGRLTLAAAFDAVMFVSEPPEFRVDSDGLVHITQHFGREGGLCVERVMRLRTFLRTIHLARRAVVEYEARGTAEIIDFPRGGGVH